MWFPSLLLVFSVAFGGDWEYSTARTSSPPTNEAEWHRTVEADASTGLWYRRRLADELRRDASLVFRAYPSELAVFFDGQPAYRYHRDERAPISTST